MSHESVAFQISYDIFVVKGEKCLIKKDFPKYMRHYSEVSPIFIWN